MLAIDFDDFYRQHSIRFHAFGIILLLFSLTLTSSISFGEYFNSGATYTKLSRIGKNPRPAGLGQAGRPTTVRFDHAALWFMVLSTRTSQPKCVSCTNYKSLPKGLNQVKLGLIPVIDQRVKTQTDLRSKMHLVINVPEQRRPENKPELGRPA